MDEESEMADWSLGGEGVGCMGDNQLGRKLGGGDGWMGSWEGRVGSSAGQAALDQANVFQPPHCWEILYQVPGAKNL